MYSVVIIIITILLTTIVFGSAAHLNHSYALQQDAKTTSVAIYHGSSHPSYDKSTACNCVVFRMDDLQDYWIRAAQITAMNLFLSKHIPLSLAIIMNSIGNDSQVVDKIREGSKGPNALFELTLHGWNHVNYADLSEKEQTDTLKKANDKMLQLFGNKSNIFVTPYGSFDADTNKAMNNVGVHILSAELVNDEQFDGNASISYANRFSDSISKIQYVPNNNNNNNRAFSYGQNPTPGFVYHFPAMSFFYEHEDGSPAIKTPIQRILVETKNNIQKYGYSVILFHPQDFVERDDKGNLMGSRVNMSEVNDLSHLIDSLIQEKIPIVHFSTLVKYSTGGYSSVEQFGYFQNHTSSVFDNRAISNYVEQFGYFQKSNRHS
jgi:peptidoglycan/xylan/chitin deacetylase (PgdA/CDA1 family)